MRGGAYAMATTIVAPKRPPSHNHGGSWTAATIDAPRPSTRASAMTRSAATITPKPAEPIVPTRRPSAPDSDACAAPAMPAASEKTTAIRVPVTPARLPDDVA
jgi:hypothetical protein